jgi:hypothetical protein
MRVQVNDGKETVPGDGVVEETGVTQEERTGSVFGEVGQLLDETEGQPLEQAKYSVRPLQKVEGRILMLKHNKWQHHKFK